MFPLIYYNKDGTSFNLLSHCRTSCGECPAALFVNVRGKHMRLVFSYSVATWYQMLNVHHLKRFPGHIRQFRVTARSLSCIPRILSIPAPVSEVIQHVWIFT